ncbi:AraC family transcriptional regulator [Balneolales bacterium ANBcel1]|nr:AraC family transcriptional regulator [Balneolales bacterium ANBcel1]
MSQRNQNKKRPADGDTPPGGEQILRIKNMVCDRCIMTVDALLRQHGFQVDKLTMGEASISPPPAEPELKKLEQALKQVGFELARDRREELVTAVKSQLISYLRQVESHGNPPLVSEFLSEKLHRSYPTISRAFSASEGLTIEKYLIRLRIERVKEMLAHGDRTLSEIAWQLGYSSVQHLSSQFRAITGSPVSEYRQNSGSPRMKLDEI